MLYLSGLHALNVPCELLTCGDWHQSALMWRGLPLLESEGSIHGEYGIELNKTIPDHNESFNVANHIRALLDLLEQGNYSAAQGMNKDFICNDNYTDEIFGKVKMFRSLPSWNEIDLFMGKEYYSKWLSYKRRSKL